MTIEVKELEGIGGLLARAETYLRTMATCDDDSVFLRPEWLAAWWKEFGEGRSLTVLEARDGDGETGYATFMSSRLGSLMRVKKLEFLAAGPSDTLGIVSEHCQDRLYDAILRTVRDGDWDLIELRDVREGGSTAKAIRRAFPHAEVTRDKVPYVAVRSNFDEYLHLLSQNARHNLVRSERRNREELGAHVIRIDSPEALGAALERLLRLNELRFASKGEETVFGESAKRFTRDAVARLGTSGIPVIHSLEVRGEPVSMCLGFEYRNRYLYYASGLDPEYSRFAPGRYLLSKVIQEAHERKLAEVDLLRGSEEYKYHLGAVDRYNVTFRVRRSSLKGILASGLKFV